MDPAANGPEGQGPDVAAGGPDGEVRTAPVERTPSSAGIDGRDPLRSLAEELDAADELDVAGRLDLLRRTGALLASELEGLDGL